MIEGVPKPKTHLNPCLFRLANDDAIDVYVPFAWGVLSSDSAVWSDLSQNTETSYCTTEKSQDVTGTPQTLGRVIGPRAEIDHDWGT